MVDRVAYDEFGLFHENAAEFGLPYDGPPVVRRAEVEVGPGRHLSALVWGEAPPELVLLHGGLLTIGLTFGAMLPTLAANHRVIAVELQGHGRTADTGRELGVI